MPPARPDFCYYEELKIDRTATQSEVVSAYRTLARLHHPDKNPNDENATARFQRIQAAHETLSDPAKRARYNNLVDEPEPSRFSHNANHRHYYEDSEDEEDDDDDSDFEFYFDGRFPGGMPGFFFGFGGGGFPGQGPHGYSFRPHTPPDFAEMERRFREQERAEQQMRDEQIARAKAEKRAKMEAEEKARKEKELRKKLQEEHAKKVTEDRERMEKDVQEKHWAKMHATTEAQKQEFCLHSAFWNKVKLTKKAKCGSCGQKRGMMAFECPHCALKTCQLCLTKFQEKRERAGKSG